MGGDSATTSNLARIRDNQRRSRARRKEYLQELETKYRNCEHLGVQASAEIQAAARRVADENKRLRALLRAKGVGDQEIDAFTGGQDGEDGNSQFPSAVQTLKTMLSERRSCNGETPCKLSPVPSEQQKSGITPKAALKPPQQPRGSVASISRGSLSPSSTSASSFATTPIISPSYTLVNPEVGPHHPQALELPFPHRPSQRMPHSQPYPQLQQYQQQEYEYPEYNVTPFPQWQQPPIPYGNSVADGIVDHGHSSSCTFAADVLRGMGADVSTEELHEQLGCSAKGADCDVENKRLFDVMDRYTSGQGSTG